MVEVANFTDRHRQDVVIDKLNNGKYCITVDGRMTQKDLSVDDVIAWFANASQTNPETATRDELVEVLRKTRLLVVACSASGFADKEALINLYTNQGEITRVVPIRSVDRDEVQRVMEKAAP